MPVVRAIGQWYGGVMKASIFFLLLVLAAGAVGVLGEDVANSSPLLDVLSFVPAS